MRKLKSSNLIHRLLAMTMALVCGLVGGCQPRDEFTDVRSERVPAPILEQPPFTYQGELGAIYSGDSVEVFVGNQSHLVRLVGIDCPEPGVEKFQQGRHFVRKLAAGIRLRVDVLWRDEANAEFGQIWAADKDLGLELVRAGLARVTDDEFEGRDVYQEAWKQLAPSNQ